MPQAHILFFTSMHAIRTAMSAAVLTSDICKPSAKVSRTVPRAKLNGRQSGVPAYTKHVLHAHPPATGLSGKGKLTWCPCPYARGLVRCGPQTGCARPCGSTRPAGAAWQRCARCWTRSPPGLAPRWSCARPGAKCWVTVRAKNAVP